jgi:hypothetical protein
LSLLRTLEPRFEADEALLGSEDDEVAGLSVFGEADVELVVLELEPRVELSSDLQQLIRHCHDLLRSLCLPVSPVRDLLDFLVFVH